jgi:hypothetical protein
LPLNQIRSPSGDAPAASHRPDDFRPTSDWRYSVNPSAPVDPIVADLLSSTDVEQIFRRSARTLHRWEQRGHLAPVRVGKAKFYHAEDIRRLIAGQLKETMLPSVAPVEPGSDKLP